MNISHLIKFQKIITCLICAIFMIILIPVTSRGSVTAGTYDYFEYEVNADNTITITGCFGSNIIDFYDLNLNPNLEIPAEIGGKPVTSIGQSAFSGCYFLESITIPDSITSIGPSAFSFCGALKNITIPEGITSIEYSTFAHCVSLENITIPDSVTSIGEEAFFYCRSLKNITIPNSVEAIGDRAFYNCTSLENVVIPESVTSIGDSVFGTRPTFVNDFSILDYFRDTELVIAFIIVLIIILCVLLCVSLIIRKIKKRKKTIPTNKQM